MPVDVAALGCRPKHVRRHANISVLAYLRRAVDQNTAIRNTSVCIVHAHFRSPGDLNGSALQFRNFDVLSFRSLVCLRDVVWRPAGRAWSRDRWKYGWLGWRDHGQRRIFRICGWQRRDKRCSGRRRGYRGFDGRESGSGGSDRRKRRNRNRGDRRRERRRWYARR